MSTKRYRKVGQIEARPYVQGESLRGVSVNQNDDTAAGGWIANDPENAADRWFITAAFFENNYEEVT